MIRSLWIAKTGLEAQQTNMDVISNNLANVNTAGFKRTRAVFEDLMYQTIRQPGAQVGAANQLPTGLQLGTGVRTVATERIHSQGGLNNTGHALGVAIQGRCYFQVEMPDGTFDYRIDGSRQIDQEGQLVTSGGYPEQTPIMEPDNAVQIAMSRNGTVAFTQPGAVGNSVEIGQPQLTTSVNPSG